MQEENLCENYFIELTDNNHERLIELLESGKLNNVQMTLAAEHAGKLPTEKIVPILLKLLNHPSPLAREGILYGLSNHDIPEVYEAILQVQMHDPSDTIKEIAEEILSDFECYK